MGVHLDSIHNKLLISMGLEGGHVRRAFGASIPPSDTYESDLHVLNF